MRLSSNSIFRGSVAFVLAALIVSACAVATTILPRDAYAADPAVYTATATASYANPDNGAIEDSGGADAATMGQSMVEGIVQPQAFVEKDVEGNTFVTLRFYQADVIGDVAVSSDASNSGAFPAPMLAVPMQMNPDTNMGDFLFQVPTETATNRLSMYVEPMGREVTFFVKLANFQPGNTAGFVQSVEVPEAAVAPSAPAEEQPAPAQEEPASASSESSQGNQSASGLDNATATSSSSAEAPAPAAKDAATSSSESKTGIEEYNAEGNLVDQSADEGGVNVPLVAGILAALVALGALAFALVRRAKKPTQDAAAAAAGLAGTPAQLGQSGQVGQQPAQPVQAQAVPQSTQARPASQPVPVQPISQPVQTQQVPQTAEQWLSLAQQYQQASAQATDPGLAQQYYQAATRAYQQAMAHMPNQSDPQ